MYVLLPQIPLTDPICFRFWLELTIDQITEKIVESGAMFIGLSSVMEFCNIVQNSVTSMNYETRQFN